MSSHDDQSADREKKPQSSEGATLDDNSAPPAYVHADPNDGDDALKIFRSDDGQAVVITPEQERRLLRKIDLNIMPILCTVYCLNYLDKVTISYASVMGLQKALHLEGDNYQWLSSMFYIGYLFWEYPTSRLLQRLPLAKWSAFNVIMWGVILCCFAATTNFAGAVAIRFLLGVFEAAVTPGFALFTSQWYTQSEQGTRTGIWFAFNGFAQIIGGAIAYGISVQVQKHGSAIASWKIVFLAWGLITISIGLLFLWLMPDSQLNAWFLTSDEKRMAIERIRKNQQGVGNKHFKVYQLKQALLDPITWALLLYALLSNITNGLSTFFNQLIVSFGFTPDQSLLYGTPGGAIEVVFVIGALWLGDKFRNRILFGITGVLVAMLGMLLIVCLPTSHKVGRLVGYYLTQASPTGFVVTLSFISSNIAGYTRKTTMGALFLIGYCIGNIISPQIFRPKDAPHYKPAEITIIVCYGACVIDLLFIYWYYNRQNRKKEAIRTAPGYQVLDNQEFLDLTDKENHEFVYTI